MIQTQRQYKEAETGEIFTMWKNPITDEMALISDNSGEVIKSFYATQIEQTVKTESGMQIYLSAANFTRQTVTHYKYEVCNLMKNFRRIKKY